MARLTRIFAHCIVFSLTVLMGIAPAATRYVGSGETFTTIQSAIDASSNGDTIIVRDGTYTGEGNRDISFGGKAIHLKSENGPTKAIIDVQGSQSDPHRGFIFQWGEGDTTVVDGFTIRNGCSTKGAAVYCYNGSSPLITRNVITQNLSTRSHKYNGIWMPSAVAGAGRGRIQSFFFLA